MLRSTAQVVAFLRSEIPQDDVEEWWPHACFPSSSKHIIECRGDGEDNRFVWCLYVDSLDKKAMNRFINEIHSDVEGLEELEIYVQQPHVSVPDTPFFMTVCQLSLGRKQLRWGNSSLLDAAQCLLRTEWKEFFVQVMPDLKSISDKLTNKVVYPPLDKVFTLFHTLNPSDIKVVIVGQDPYHGANQAMGIAFSVMPGVKVPPSLVNIFKEVESCTKIKNTSGDLTSWVKQGVFLINTALTVEDGSAGSHCKLWKNFTQTLMTYLNDRCADLIVLSWGSHAHEVSAMLSKHTILRSVHPSPLSASRGFFGCGHFSDVNYILKKKGKTPISWAT